MNKTLSFIIVSVFSLVLLVSFASATTNLAISNINIPASVQNDAGSFQITFNITNTGNSNATIDWTTAISEGSVSSTTFSTNLVENQNSSLVIATLNFALGQTGNIAGNINAANLTGPGSGDDFDFTIALTEVTPDCDDFCSDCDVAGNPGNILYITDIDFSLIGGAKGDGKEFGDDEDYWYPFDEVEVTFEVKNKGDYDVDDIEIEMCLWDKDEAECVLDEKDMDLNDKEIKLDENEDSGDLIATFVVDPDDFKEGNTDYILYVRAFGNIDDKDAGSLDGNDTCITEDKEIEIRTDEEFVIIREFDAPEVVQRGATVEVTAEIWNIGEDKIDDEDLYVEVRSGTLGFVEPIEIGDLSSFESDEISFSFTIPANAEEKTHTIYLTVYDDERMDDDDIYENSENDKAVYRFAIIVRGGETPKSTVSVSAALETQAKAGEKAVASIDLTNIGTSLESYTLSITGYSDWASSASLSKTSFAIAAGSSDVSNVTFQVKEDVLGEQTFEVKVMSNGVVVLTQPVTISIQESKSEFSFPETFGDNWYLWLIGIINVVLILIIIVVAIKIANS